MRKTKAPVVKIMGQGKDLSAVRYSYLSIRASYPFTHLSRTFHATMRHKSLLVCNIRQRGGCTLIKATKIGIIQIMSQTY
jgi:hypothetical protein